MNLLETFRVAFTSLLANKLRAILTMLGIIIGVGAVITLLALGNAIQLLVNDQLQGLGSNLVFVFGGTSDPDVNRRVPPALTNEDAAALADPLNVPAALAVAAQYSNNATVTYSGASFSGRVAGVTPNFPQVRNAKIALGSFSTKPPTRAVRAWRCWARMCAIRCSATMIQLGSACGSTTSSLR